MTQDFRGTKPNQVPRNSDLGSAAYMRKEDIIAEAGGSPSWDDVTDKPSTFPPASHSHNISDINDFPNLATVATTGSYDDLAGKPMLATVATSGAYADLSGTPTLATVATSGSYNDLSDKPVIGGGGGADLWFDGRAALVTAWSDGDADDGTIVSDSYVFYIAESGATVIPDLTGLVPYQKWTGHHFGMVADATDTYEGGAWHHKYEWQPNTAYEVGDIVQISGSPNISRMCISAHTSPSSWSDNGSLWVSGSFAGTDNTAAFQAALDASFSAREVLHIPKGYYRFRDPSTVNSGTVNGLTQYWSIEFNTWQHIEFEPGAEFFLDENPGTNPAIPNTFLGNQFFNGVEELNVHEKLIIRNMSLRGRWSHIFMAGETVRHANALRCTGYREMELYRYRVVDWRGNPSAIDSIGMITVLEPHMERCASDCVRVLNSNNVIVGDGYFKDTSDDAIAIHTRDRAVNFDRAPGVTIIRNNRLIKAESIQCLGLGRSVVIGNFVQFPQGSGLNVGSSNHPEGSASTSALVVANNVVENNVTHWFPSSGWPARALTTGYITVAGTILSDNGVNGALPGDYKSSTQEVIDFWQGFSLHGNDFNNEGGDTTLSAAAPSHAHIVSGNVMSRTYPTNTTFDEIGLGWLFTKIGWYNPTITDTAHNPTGLVVLSDSDTFVISDNTFSGLEAGLLFAVRNPSPDPAKSFRNILITDNNFTDVGLGISSNRRNSGTKVQLGAVIQNNNFDLDPFFKSNRRVTPINGGWVSSTTSDLPPIGVELTGWRGAVVKGNTYRNCYSPISPLFLDNFIADHHLENELVVCQPVATGYNANNRGVGVVHPSGPSIRYMIEDPNPTSGTFRELLNTCVMQAGALPTSGTYVQGAYVSKHNPSSAGGVTLQGWRRRTTGNGHVIGTDWIPVYSSDTTAGGGGGAAAINATQSLTGALSYNGVTRAAGHTYGGSTPPLSSTQLNYDGYFRATRLNSVEGVNVGGFLTVSGGASFGGFVTMNGLLSADAGITMSNQRIINLLSPNLPDHAANKSYVDSQVGASDYRLKENLRDPLHEANEVLNAVQTYAFDWKDGSGSSVGVLAHELAEIMPGAVMGEKDGDETQRVRYDRLVPYLMVALKDALARIDELEKSRDA